MMRFGRLLVLLAGLVGSGQTACAITPDASGTVRIPPSWTAIAPRAFRGCLALVNLDMSANSVMDIGEESFSGCTNLRNLDLGGAVRTIGHLAFSDCSSVVTFTIPDSVITIAWQAFRDMYALRSVTIPATARYDARGLQHESYHPFYRSYCENRLGQDVNMFFPGANVLNCSQCMIHPDPNDGSLTIPSSMTTIPFKAFKWCHSLISLVVPDSTDIIGDEAFALSSNLATVRIGSSATNANPSVIGTSAFICHVGG